jgi:microcompartment protein CcmL/EutN
MRLRTIGCIEVNSVSVGMYAADEMTKAAEVSLALARPTCPGRYLALVAGDTAAVQRAVEKGREICGAMLVDSFVIPSVHEEVIPALTGGSVGAAIGAVGVIETYTTASCILAADAAAKSGAVHLLEIRFAAGLAGKSFVVMTGDVASVQSSVRAGLEGVGDSGPVHSHIVIPSPGEGLRAQLR